MRYKKPKAEILKSTELELKSSQYQPSKEEKEVEIDMPGMTEDELRKVFFRPFKMRRKN